MVGLVVDLLELKSEPQDLLEAVVIESSLSPQQGSVATVVVKKGTLKVGDKIYAEVIEGKVKALIDDRGERVKQALPGDPVEVLGFSEVPSVGVTVTTEKLPEKEEKREARFKVPEEALNVILRADNQGSLEAIAASLEQLKIKERGVNILLSGVGPIVDSDIYLAQSAGGVVFGFNVGITPSSQKLAEDLNIGMRTFTVIYDLLEAANKLLRGVLELEKAKVKGEGEVIKTFTLHSGDIVLGVRVTAGKIKYRDKVKLMRGEEEVHQGRVRGLKVGKEEVPQVKEGQEAGLLIKPQSDDFKVKDKLVVC